MKLTQEPNSPKKRKTGKQPPNANGLGEIIEPEERPGLRLIMGAKDALRVLGQHYSKVELTEKMARYMDDSPYWHEPMDPSEMRAFYDTPEIPEDRVLEAVSACDKDNDVARSFLSFLSEKSNYESVRKAAREALEEGR